MRRRPSRIRRAAGPGTHNAIEALQDIGRAVVAADANGTKLGGGPPLTRAVTTGRSGDGFGVSTTRAATASASSPAAAEAPPFGPAQEDVSISSGETCRCHRIEGRHCGRRPQQVLRPGLVLTSQRRDSGRGQSPPSRLPLRPPMRTDQQPATSGKLCSQTGPGRRPAPVPVRGAQTDHVAAHLGRESEPKTNEPCGSSRRRFRSWRKRPRGPLGGACMCAPHPLENMPWRNRARREVGGCGPAGASACRARAARPLPSARCVGGGQHCCASRATARPRREHIRWPESVR